MHLQRAVHNYFAQLLNQWPLFHPLRAHPPKLLWLSQETARCGDHRLSLWQMPAESSWFGWRKRSCSNVFKTAFGFITEPSKASQLLSVASKNRAEGKLTHSKPETSWLCIGTFWLWRVTGGGAGRWSRLSLKIFWNKILCFVRHWRPQEQARQAEKEGPTILARGFCRMHSDYACRLWTWRGSVINSRVNSAEQTQDRKCLV